LKVQKDRVQGLSANTFHGENRYPTCCNTLHNKTEPIRGAGYLSSNISDVSPIIDPPPRPTPRGPNRLA